MRQTKKEQALRRGGVEMSQLGRDPKGPLPGAGEMTAEFAAEPGVKPTYGRSGNPRVHKS